MNLSYIPGSQLHERYFLTIFLCGGTVASFHCTQLTKTQLRCPAFAPEYTSLPSVAHHPVLIPENCYGCRTRSSTAIGRNPFSSHVQITNRLPRRVSPPRALAPLEVVLCRVIWVMVNIVTLSSKTSFRLVKCMVKCDWGNGDSHVEVLSSPVRVSLND